MVTTRDWLPRPTTTAGRHKRRWAMRRDRRQGPPGRRRTPELLALERRELQTIIFKQTPTLVSPRVLPPNGKNLPVVFTGVVASTRPQTPTGFFHVTDEYRQYEPFGSVALTPVGLYNGNYGYSFRFTVRFPASRSTNTADGRHYYVMIGAKDQDNANGRTVAVLVPKTYPPPVHGQAVVAGPSLTATRARPH
jgi:hypothetical protein